MQPSQLALRQIQAVIEQLNHSQLEALRDGSQQLLKNFTAAQQQSWRKDRLGQE